jgi:hypothetical protein
MYLETKSEIFRKIGRNSFFKKKLKTEAILSYKSGINELNHLLFNNDKMVYFYLIKHPDGIYISDGKGKYTLGIRFQELKNVEITKLSETEYELVFTDNLRRKLIFSFCYDNRLTIIYFVKFLNIKYKLDSRDSELIKEEILQLKKEFEVDYISQHQFSEMLESSGLGFSKKRLTINENEIRYDGKVLETNKVFGFSLGIEELRKYGVSRFEYGVNIYSAEEHLYIRFTSVSVFLKQGEHTNLLNQIGDVLYDLIVRPKVANWFISFLNNEVIDFKDFSISKYGLTIKVNNSPVIIHWDELRVMDLDLYRWPYTNTVFLRLDSSHDYRSFMLFLFITWLQDEPSRVEKLMGRTYYID